jgi:hypothetical protein
LLRTLLLSVLLCHTIQFFQQTLWYSLAGMMIIGYLAGLGCFTGFLDGGVGKSGFIGNGLIGRKL